MGLRFNPLTRDQECDRLLQKHVDPDFERVSLALERQFQTIHNRAQLLLGVCGVLISASVLVTTGRLVLNPVGHSRAAGHLLIVAGTLDIAAAAVVVVRVISVRWITQQPGADVRGWVLTNLRYRDSKTRAYRVAAAILLLSMICYQVAIAMAVLTLQR